MLEAGSRWTKREAPQQSACRPRGPRRAFRTVEDGLDTQGSTGKLVLHMLSAVAQFERDLIIERTGAGLAMARKNGKRLGPPVKWQPDMAKQARRSCRRANSRLRRSPTS